jgi:hypothetical protein
MKTFAINRNDTIGESIENKMGTFFKIFNWKCNESEVIFDEEPYWHYGNAIWTAIKTDNGAWTQTLLICNEDLGADGPLGYIIKSNSNLWSFEDVDILIRESFANCYAGKISPNDDEELQNEWWGWFNLAHISHAAYLDEEVGVTNPKFMTLEVMA